MVIDIDVMVIYFFDIDKYLLIVFFKPYSKVSQTNACPIDTSFILGIWAQQK